MDTLAAEDFEIIVKALIAGVSYRPGYEIIIQRDAKDPEGRLYLQVQTTRPDSTTGELGIGRGGKAYLSEYMTDGEILRKAFQLLLAYEEHEVREHFKWEGRAIFGPHIDVKALWRAAEKLDVRAPKALK